MRVYSVSQVTAYLREVLEGDPILRDLWVSGEISNVSRSAAGHLYFTLKDERSELSCVFFRNDQNGSVVADGMAALVGGRVSIYPERGRLQVIVRAVLPEGLGRLQLEFEQLKTRLQGEGLFDPARKRPLPVFPRRIGVATSTAGAVLHDIINVLGRRYPLVEIVVAATPVQGDEAAAGIVAALTRLNALDDLDLIILARGGGSLEELWPFNEEVVARAIYASRVPVVAGIGHEPDVTIADYVADLSCPTPSAAAERSVPDVADLRRHIVSCAQRALAAARHAVVRRRSELSGLRRALERYALDVGRQRQRLDDLLRQAGLHLSHRAELWRQRLVSIERRFESLSPLATLQRGYAIVQTAGAAAPVIRRVQQVARGDPLRIQVADGAFAGRVTSVPRRGAETALQTTLLSALDGPFPLPLGESLPADRRGQGEGP